jgi:hypothetical protein
MKVKELAGPNPWSDNVAVEQKGVAVNESLETDADPPELTEDVAGNENGWEVEGNETMLSILIISISKIPLVFSKETSWPCRNGSREGWS